MPVEPLGSGAAVMPAGQDLPGSPRVPSPFDEVAWASVDARFRRALQTFAIRMGLSDCDAEDVAQESLAALAAGVRAGRVKPGSSDIGAYLFGIARRQVAMAIRRRYGITGSIQSVTDTWIDTMPEAAREREVWEQTWAV